MDSETFTDPRLCTAIVDGFTFNHVLLVPGREPSCADELPADGYPVRDIGPPLDPRNDPRDAAHPVHRLHHNGQFVGEVVGVRPPGAVESARDGFVRRQ
ncbi:hypothetical protein SMIR_16645 [Streptomyces mirabilis]|nr:hypothetical protein [Streptomyces mirabilis]QUW80560.1 hypothetical protein SMIR_16645 [Streptomyces mirabilis]